MKEIKCPYDLNQFIINEPIFENPFPEEECKQRKFYGDCYHCFATAIASRDHQLLKKEQPKQWIHKNDDYCDWLECPNCGYGDEGEVKFGEGTLYCPCCGQNLSGKWLINRQWE